MEISRVPQTRLRKMDCFMLKCIVCSEDYCKDNRPRNLLCGHSLCTRCSEQFVTDQKFCPECHETHLPKDANELPLNYSLVELMNSDAFEKVDMTDIGMPLYPADLLPSDLKEVALKCGIHANPVAYFCCKCCVWVCEDCLVVEHPNVPRGSCRIIRIPDALLTIKSEHKSLTDEMSNIIEDMKRALEFQMNIQNCSKHCPVDNKSHDDFISQAERQFKEFRNFNTDFVEQVKGRMRDSVNKMDAALLPEDVTRIYNDSFKFRDTLPDDIERKMAKLQPAIETILNHLKLDLFMLAEGKDPIYVVLDENNKKSRWAEVITKENCLLLCCLTEGSPSSDGITLPFEYVKKLVPEENAMIYLEVGTAEKVLGEVKIGLEGNDATTLQAVLLCTGEKGPSYKNTCFCHYHESQNILVGGDYENNDGTGGSPIVTGLDKCEFNQSDEFTGAVSASDRSHGRLFIFLGKGRIGPSVPNVYGRVREGLEVLKTVAETRPVTSSIIRNCGVYIPQ